MKKKPVKKTLDFGDDEKIEKLLSPKRGVELKIDAAFEGVEVGSNVLVLSNQSTNFSVSLSLLRRFLKKPKAMGIYVSVNKPALKIGKEFEREGIELKKMKFIDMITLEVGSSKVAEKNISYVSSTSSLNELLDEVTRLSEENRAAEKLFILDSVSTLLVYNEEINIEKLVHAISGRLNKFGSIGFFLMSRSKEHEDIVQTISQFCDKIIDLDQK